MAPPDAGKAPSGAVAADRRQRRDAAREERRRIRLRRRRVVLAGAVLLTAAGAAAAVWPAGKPTHGPGPDRRAPVGARPDERAARFAVGLRVLRFTDATRTIPGGQGASRPRPLVTVVRYPAVGRSSAGDVAGAPAAVASGPFPLIVFGHGFDLTPSFYAALLRTWAAAGYVVAAPRFPLENASAPGGPDEADLVNQPADLRFVLSRMLGLNAAPGPLAGLVDPGRIAVAGHSDGGDTALAVAYGRADRDRRVGAAIILAGATLPGTGIASTPGSPPLLAVQGTADPVNPSKATDTFFGTLRRPKFRLRLLGAGHLGPYSSRQPQLGIVEASTTAFLDLYLRRQPPALARLLSAGSVRGLASLSADP